LHQEADASDGRDLPCRIGSGGEEAHSRVPALQAKEAEVNEAVSLLKVRGRPVGHIHDRRKYWMRNFIPDAYVRGIWTEGYRIPVKWEKIPESYEEPDNRSAKEHYTFVRE
jgi:hypothetical protein